MIVEKIQTWDDNWNQIVRTIIFKDTKLLNLMMIPSASRTDLVKFIREHFVETSQPDEPLLNQNV